MNEIPASTVILYVGKMIFELWLGGKDKQPATWGLLNEVSKELGFT